MRVVSMQKLVRAAVAAALFVVVPAAGQAQSLTQPGTQAVGISNWGYFPCATTACTPTGGSMSLTQVGGVGQNSAATAFSGIAPGAAGVPFQQYLASAQMQGLLGLAQHRAAAQSVTMTGTPPGYTGLCCYYYDVNAVSTALQWYTFTGTQPQTFTIAYTIDAILTAFDDPNDPYDYSIFAGASGGLSIFDGVVDPNLALELPLGSNLDLSQVFLDGTMAGTGGGGAVSGSGSVTFTLNPGSGFFLSSFLSASVPQQVPGWVSADASHTMNMQFTQGDTRLLQASLPGVPSSSVPEPSSWALFALGLTGMAVVARRRGRRA